MLERLQKIIASAGGTSRRKAEELIQQGRVRVNGQTVTELGSKADAAGDHIRVDGRPLRPTHNLTYVLLNKPVGYVSTVSDPQHRATVNDVELSLTPTEFKLLWALVRQPGRAFSRHELMEAAMGDDALVLERTIDVHVKSLRQKLGEKSEQIETVRGVGYRFRE